MNIHIYPRDSSHSICPYRIIIFPLKVGSPTKLFFFHETILLFIQSPKPVAGMADKTYFPPRPNCYKYSRFISDHPSALVKISCGPIIIISYIRLRCLCTRFSLNTVQFLFSLADILCPSNASIPVQVARPL